MRNSENATENAICRTNKFTHLSVCATAGT